MSLWAGLLVVGQGCSVENAPDLFVIIVLANRELLQSVK